MRPVATYIKAEFEAHENIHMTPDIDGNPALRLIGDVRFAFVFRPKEDQPTNVAFCRRCREIMKNEDERWKTNSRLTGMLYF